MKNRRAIAVSLCFFAGSLPVHPELVGQSAAEAPTRIRFTPLSESTSSGLASNHVRDLVQDVRGYVWIATAAGLNSFDGWETASLPLAEDPRGRSREPHLTALASTRDAGPVWIGTADSGLIRFDHPSGTIRTWRRDAENARDLPSDAIVDLAITDDEILWIGTDQGLARLDLSSERLSPVEEGPGASPIAFVTVLRESELDPRESELWVGTMDGKLYNRQRNQDGFSLVWETSTPLAAVAVDSENRLWIGTDGGGLYYYDTDQSRSPLPALLDSPTVTALLMDSAANLWVGTPKGLALRNRDDGRFSWLHHHPRRAESLVDDRITAIYEDRSRMLWIGTAGGGTSRFHLEREWFSHIRSSGTGPHDLPDPVVRYVAEGPDRLVWLGTDAGLAAWHPEQRKFVPALEIPDLDGIGIGPMAWDGEGTLWVGTRGRGLVQREIDGELRIHRHEPSDSRSLRHNHVSALLPSSGGTLYIGTLGRGLLAHARGVTGFDEVEFAEAEAPRLIHHLAEDRNASLWIASDRGVFVLGPEPGPAVPLSSWLPAAEPLTSPRVSTILPDSNGIVWIGTMESGLDRINLQNGEKTNFNSAVHGLPDDEIRSLIRDREGFLWVATRTGVARLHAMQNQFRVFSYDDGLQTAGFSRRAVAADSTGLLYFGGQDGFNVVNPSRLPPEARVPTPVLTSFEYFGERVHPSPGGLLEKELAATDSIRLPYDPRTRFAINFGSLDHRALDRGYFRYMLEGHDLEWTVATEKRSASYTGLRPGDYRFLVQSSVDGIDWADFTANVRLRLSPPWWQAWWFRLLSIATLIFGSVLATKLVINSRLRQLRQREQRLTAERDRAEAELARQLQNHMLIERAASRLHSELREDQILNDALAGITEHFGASLCLVYRLETLESADLPAAPGAAPGKRRLKRVGYFTRFAGASGSAVPSLRLDDPLSARILESEGILALDSRSAMPDSIVKVFPETSEVSALASKTSFLDNANGIVLLMRVGAEEAWTATEIKLLEALSGQFGIALAQLDTAATEERYRRHLEEAKHEAEVANRAKSDFLAKMTHELRTPLNAIIGFSEILGADPQLNERQRETLEIINNSGEHLLDVINEILDLSKIEAGKMELHEEAFPLVPLLKSVYEMLAIKAEQKRIGFHFMAKSRMPLEVLTDRSKLRQILINLVGNAIKFTAQGAVSLSAKVVPLSAAREIDHRFRRRIRIEFEVRDTGRGIQEGEIPKLFERYSQTESGRRSTEGTGLGLPIARSFVQLLGGDVEVESVFGEGTVFRFHIECEEQSVATTAGPERRLALDETNAQRIVGFVGARDEEVRILIAEDQPTNRLLLKKILGKVGFTLAEAENGAIAVEKWREWQPHLILMDEDMPEKRGSEATREIKAEAGEGKGPIIISLTAYALTQAKESALEAGCSDFVAKPFRAYELFAVISKHLGIEYRFSDAA